MNVLNVSERPRGDLESRNKVLKRNVIVTPNSEIDYVSQMHSSTVQILVHPART